MFDALIRDLRHAVRQLFKSPAFSVTAIAILGLGIGANTAIFSVVNGVILRPLPYPDSGRIVRVWTTTAEEPKSNHSAGDFMDLQRGSKTLAALTGFRSDAFTVIT